MYFCGFKGCRFFVLFVTFVVKKISRQIVLTEM